MRRFKVSRKKVLVLLLIGALLLVGLWGTGSGLVYLSARGRTFDQVDDLPKRTAALVLGCTKYLEGNRLNLFFQYRVEAAAAVYHAGKADYIIVSGDNSRSEYDEPSDMKDALIAKGVPAEKIYCDYAGFRTLDSVVRAREIFDQTSFIIVSQGFHNERAIFLGDQFDIDIVGYNARDVRQFHSFRTRAREQLARIKAVLDVYLLRTQPKFLGEKVPLGIPQADVNR